MCVYVSRSRVRDVNASVTRTIVSLGRVRFNSIFHLFTTVKNWTLSLQSNRLGQLKTYLNEGQHNLKNLSFLVDVKKIEWVTYINSSRLSCHSCVAVSLSQFPSTLSRRLGVARRAFHLRVVSPEWWNRGVCWIFSIPVAHPELALEIYPTGHHRGVVTWSKGQ